MRIDGNRIVAMLLRTDFDHAASRAHLFASSPVLAKKVVLTKRIRWFEDSTGSPSYHCWMIWDQEHRGPPTLAYAMHNGRQLGHSYFPGPPKVKRRNQAAENSGYQL
jgi:hypothetical protein